MKYLKLAVIAVIVLGVLAFLHYTLPRSDVVRVVGTDIRRINASENSWFWAGSESVDPASGTRDVRFINAVTENDNARVYRNEDTGWGWPPYFKFDSADLQARAAGYLSGPEDTQWVEMRYYGVRFNLMSIFPNALGVEPVVGPSEQSLPWTRIIVMPLAIIVLIFGWVRARRIWQNRVDPMVRSVSGGFESKRQVRDGGHPAKRQAYRGRVTRMREWWVEHFG